MSGQHQSEDKVPRSQPLTDWLARQYDTPAARMVGPWSSAWDGGALASQGQSPPNQSTEQ
jgi:hypothetical protein